MEVTVDPTGRVLVPEALRDRWGLTPGSTVDVSAYGDGALETYAVPTGLPAPSRVTAAGAATLLRTRFPPPLVA